MYKAKYLQPQVSTKGLVAWWKLDNFVSSGKIFDYGLGGYEGTVNGTSCLPVYPGFDFTVVQNDYIDIGAGPASVKTMSFWVKLDDVAGNEYPFDLNGTDYISIESGVVTVNGLVGHTLYVDGVVGTSGVTTITAGKWHHIVVTDATANNASDLDIGRVSVVYFDGVISEVRLYDRVLSALKVLDIYSLQKWRYGR